MPKEEANTHQLAVTSKPILVDLAFLDFHHKPYYHNERYVKTTFPGC